MAEEWDLGGLLKIGSKEQPVSSRDGLGSPNVGKSRREDEIGEENAQKKARTTNENSGSLVDFIANMDWTGFFDDDKGGDAPGEGMGAGEEQERLSFSVTQQVTKLADTSNLREKEPQTDLPYVTQEPCTRLLTSEQGHRLPYTIPGPAGATQLGISYNNDKENMTALKNVDDNLDKSEYRSLAWLKALEYFHISETDPVKFSQRDSTISHIKSSGVDRVPQMVAIIKTCTPNGNGDAYVTLKDPTGTISGTIHRRLLAETEFGRDIVPDAAILLCKVSVFRPCPRAHYLNITMNNVVQVFRNDRLHSA